MRFPILTAKQYHPSGVGLLNHPKSVSSNLGYYSRIYSIKANGNRTLCEAIQFSVFVVFVEEVAIRTSSLQRRILREKLKLLGN